MSKVVSDTSKTYDDCIGKKDTESFITLFPDEVVNRPSSEEEALALLKNDKLKVSNKDLRTGFIEKDYYCRVKFNFKSEEDYNRFISILGLNINKNTQEIYYPPEQDTVSLF